MAIAIAGPETRVIPGHGLVPVGSNQVEEFLEMIVNVRDDVREMIGEGFSLEQVMTEDPTAAYDGQWGQEESWTANDFVPIIYYESGGGSLFSP